MTWAVTVATRVSVRGGGGGDARRSGGAAVGDDDVGGGGRDDDESVSRGGTPTAPLSDGSGATPGDGAAGSEASETSERAGASGTRDEVGGDDDGEGGEGNARATKARAWNKGREEAGRAIRAAAAWRARG